MGDINHNSGTVSRTGSPDIELASSDIKAAFAAGQLMTASVAIQDHRPVIIIPKDSQTVRPELAKLENPRFLTACPTFHDVKPFIDYLRDFKDFHSRCFFNEKGEFLAVLDYHMIGNDVKSTPIITGEAFQRHGDHQAKLVLKHSPEWLAWIGKSETPMTQTDFAEFLEDHAEDVSMPGIEQMMAVATGLQATSGATFRSAINQSNGAVKVQFDEDIKGVVQGRDLEIPTEFQVAIRPFMGCSRYPVTCRFRWRLNGGNLRMHFKAMSTDWILEAALEAIVKRIAEEAGIIPALGSHNAPAMASGF